MVQYKSDMKCPNLCMKQAAFETAALQSSSLWNRALQKSRALLLPVGNMTGIWTFERVPRFLHVENQNKLLAKRSNWRHKKDNPIPASSQTCSQWSLAPWPSPKQPQPISRHHELACLLKEKKRGSFPLQTNDGSSGVLPFSQTPMQGPSLCAV